MALTTKQQYGLGIAAVVILLAIIFWKRISSALGLNGSDDSTGTGGRRMASISGADSINLSVGEKMIFDKAKRELESLGITRSTAGQRRAEINSIAQSMNRSFSNIGSSIVAKEKNKDNADCDSLCKAEKCRGSFSSWLFGFCFCLGCPDR